MWLFNAVTETVSSMAAGAVPVGHIHQIVGARESYQVEPDIPGSMSTEAKLSWSFVCGLCEYLKQNSTLTELDLRRCAIGDSGAKKVSEFLLVNRGLRKIILENNNIGDSGCLALVPGLENSRTLIELHLSRNKITGKGAAALASALASNRTLTLLDLSTSDNPNENAVGDEGCVALGRAVATNNVFLYLNLSGRNSISPTGAGALGQGLSMMSCGLQSLNLSGNNVGNNGAQYLSNGLKQNRSLTELKLSNCNIFDEGIAELGKGIRKHVGLVVLDLSRNSVGVNGARELGHTLADNPRIQQLGVFDNLIYQVRSRQPTMDCTSLQQGTDYAQVDAAALAFLSAFLDPPSDNKEVLAPPPMSATYFASSGIPAKKPVVVDAATANVMAVNRGVAPQTNAPDTTHHVRHQWAPPSAGVPMPGRSDDPVARGPSYYPEVIIFDHANFGSAEAGHALASIAVYCGASLKTLQLRNCNFTDDTLSPFLGPLANNQIGCSTLDLCSNRDEAAVRSRRIGAPNGITDAGAASLAAALTSNNHLTSLRLLGNYVGPDGMAKLTPTVKELDLLNPAAFPVPQAPVYQQQQASYPPQGYQQYDGYAPSAAQYNPPLQPQYGGQQQQYGAPPQAQGPPAQYGGPPQQYAAAPSNLSGPPPPQHYPPQTPPPPQQQQQGPPLMATPQQQQQGPPLMATTPSSGPGSAPSPLVDGTPSRFGQGPAVFAAAPVFRTPSSGPSLQ
eukprot:CAMPEP_0114561752 /NCGR_PEP_ID=MMETSP0114-20121206/12168_1 /TAXON_ID=31324 /ORGANISM="Goniomonas sp, Strain m" /LENGTH=731 /DNA_ID=CAMNT_0001747401 /DNA_START=118 /DNA_END=2313 /DNA_ORIENTATION=+